MHRSRWICHFHTIGISPPSTEFFLNFVRRCSITYRNQHCCDCLVVWDADLRRSTTTSTDTGNAGYFMGSIRRCFSRTTLLIRLNSTRPPDGWRRRMNTNAKVLAQPSSLNGELKHIEWDARDLRESQTIRFTLFSTQQTRSQRHPSHAHRTSSTLSLARFGISVDWRAIGTLFCSTPMNTGAKANAVQFQRQPPSRISNLPTNPSKNNAACRYSTVRSKL